MSRPGIAARKSPHLCNPTPEDLAIRRYVHTKRTCLAYQHGRPSKECEANGGVFISTGPHNRYCTSCGKAIGEGA